MKSPPQISVVIPCYNGREFVAEAIRSATEQTVPPIELIVVDDGSTDDSASIAKAASPLVRLISQKNQGESVARNRGFEEARGDWIAFLDADDIWKPTKLEDQVALIDDDVVCIHTAYYRFGARGGVVNRSNVPPKHRYSVEFLAINGFVHPSSILVRKSVRSRFPTWTRYSEDKVFVQELSQEGRFRMVPAALVGYRCHENNQTARPDRDILWHQTAMKWLETANVDQRTFKRIHRGWNDRLIAVGIIWFLRGRGRDASMLLKYVAKQQVGLWGWLMAPWRVITERVLYFFRPRQTG